MKVTKVLGLAAVGAMLAMTAPAERALALSLATPGATATVQDKSMTTQVHWQDHRGWPRGRHHHHHHHHRY
ncbi:hypothetical protein [Bradyrhizobium lablabi]|uniref:hypothetical protein n=1 Tax=Bradyrhizobium lablabi TaxID=722472 RepID=UPI001BAC4F82|nr:hypothetical protein [Bradyrhizobium lablabi]MBR0695397.1 hypothetical protein [Bradyrhizobium lablabi]